MKNFCRLAILIFFISHYSLLAKGNVYLVIGSDTGIWDGASVSIRHCYYDQSLYTDPERNAAKVMDFSFRNRLVDSFGNHMRLTWWMHGGNMFRNASNNNFPSNNTMALYLMKKYHGEAIEALGDELTLHYHTWRWTDYDGDGKFYWNQTFTFEECREDFDVTLAQYLLDENVFPVSFRSGWHYMDNGWQRRLDEILPFSMHNDYPAKNTDTTEPLDNTYDWSQAPSEFIPYRVSPENYQLPGNGRGWNVRSKYLGNVTQEMMDEIFQKAAQGIDQVACFWAHLPESNFLQNLERIDELAHNSAIKFPSAKFYYLTAVDAMQKWLKTDDFTAPDITIEQEVSGEEIVWTIQTNEPIFQPVPFVAAKDIYKRYKLANCIKISETEWQATLPFPEGEIAKAGVALCDTVGNLATKIINYLPDELFLDNLDQNFLEIRGNWFSDQEAAWGVDSRQAVIEPGDSAVARWNFYLSPAHDYALYFQMPALSDPVDSVTFRIYETSNLISETTIKSPFPEKKWIFIDLISKLPFDQGQQTILEMSAPNHSAQQRQIAADVVKITALIPKRQLKIFPEFIDFGEASLTDTITQTIIAENNGREPLIIFSINSENERLKIRAENRIRLEPFSRKEIKIELNCDHIGIFEDSLKILSNDPLTPEKRIAFKAIIEKAVKVFDNEDAEHYSEHGDWHYSVATAYGPTSRYCFLHQTGSYAKYSFTVPVSGYYEVFEIVPKTSNATDNALYEIKAGEVTCDSVYIDQNEGSGNWVSLGGHFFPASTPATIKVINTGEFSKGDVLRADAIRIKLVREITDVEQLAGNKMGSEFELFPNYPNPFNSSTTVSYFLPERVKVSLKVFDLLGREVMTVFNGTQERGNHQIHVQGHDLTTGVYLLKMEAASYSQTRKFVVVK